MRLMRNLISSYVTTLALATTAALTTAGTTAHAAPKKWQLGVDVGSEATYGNSITMGYRMWEYDQIHWGLGYNSTGAKVGVGNDLMVNVFSSFGIKAGAALVYSAGTSGEVEVDSRFEPDGSNKDEELVAVKEYELSPSLLMGFGVGAFYDYFQFLRLNMRLCYNIPLTGNEVTLGEDISYDKDVEVTNEEEFSDEFDREAERIVRAGGFGFSLGAAFIF
jgi:hypothetical protein